MVLNSLLYGNDDEQKSKPEQQDESKEKENPTKSTSGKKSGAENSKGQTVYDTAIGLDTKAYLAKEHSDLNSNLLKKELVIITPEVLKK